MSADLIANCLGHAQVPPETRTRWTALLEEVSISHEALRSIQGEARKTIARIERIVGTGSQFVYEEVLLVITLRVELDLVSAYLAQRGLGALPDVDRRDEEITSVFSTSAHSSISRSAQQTARRNWGLPLHSKWLGNDSVRLVR